MIEVVETGEFDTWLRKLKDKQGKLRILERIDRLAHGNPGDGNRLAKESRNFGSHTARAIGSNTCKKRTV